MTIQITFSNLKYILNKKVPIENRVLITGITTSVTVQFFFEPVLTVFLSIDLWNHPKSVVTILRGNI